MAKPVIAKNVTGSLREFLNLKLQGGTQSTLSARYSPYQIDSDPDLPGFISAGDIVINDGTGDLSIADALVFIKIVRTVNGYTEDVVLDPDDLDDSGSTNKFTSAGDISKLAGVESGATGDQTGAEIKALYELEPSAYTDTLHTKLTNLESSHYKGEYTTLGNLQAAHPTAIPGDYADVDAGIGQDVERYIWDDDDTDWIHQLGSSAVLTDGQIKTQYENNANTNEYSDGEQTKVGFISVTQAVNLDTIESDTATNNTKVSADGSVTSHSDISSAGSGDIITGVERTKLNGIETAATADQTGAEIGIALFAEVNINNFTDLEKSKLGGIEANATADQTGAEIKSLYEVEANAFTDEKNISLLKMESTGFEGSPPILSINGGDNTKFDYTASVIVHVDNSTAPATITRSVISAAVGVTPTFLASETASFLSFDSAGALVQRVARSTAEQRRTGATLGLVSHVDNATIDSVVMTPQLTTDIAATVADIIRGLGFFSTGGNQISGVSTTLTLNKATGSGFALNENAAVNAKDPHNFVMPALTPATLLQILQDVTVVSVSATIDPTIYDNAGVQTTVPANNNATIAYVYAFPNNTIVYLLGQEVFATFSDAKDAAGTETVVVPADLSQGGLLLARVILKKNATDITDPTEAFILPSTAVSGGGAALTSMQQGYEISAQPEIKTNATQGSVDLEGGTGDDNDLIQTIKNNAGSIVISFDGNGNIAVVGTVDGRDIATDGTAQDNHIASTANPHDVTFTQAVAEDGGTDITAGEAEELTDGSTTTLHNHDTPYYEVESGTTYEANGGWNTIPSMSITPAAGTYLASFSAGIYIDGDNHGETRLALDGSEITGTFRRLDATTSGFGVAAEIWTSVHSQKLVTFTGSETITAQAQENDGTFEVHHRSLNLIKVTN